MHPLANGVVPSTEQTICLPSKLYDSPHVLESLAGCGIVRLFSDTPFESLISPYPVSRALPPTSSIVL